MLIHSQTYTVHAALLTAGALMWICVTFVYLAPAVAPHFRFFRPGRTKISIPVSEFLRMPEPIGGMHR